MDERVFVFRIAQDSNYVKKELKAGRLRQGWGNKQTSLLGVSENEWVIKQSQRDPFLGSEEYYSSKYKNLSIMMDIKPGDILIIPKAPDYTSFTICRACGGYTFTEPEGFGEDDFYHMIPIDPGSIRVYHYHSCENAKIIHAKLRAYQSPLNNVWNEVVKSAAVALLTTEQPTENRPTTDIVTDIKTSLFQDSALQRFRNLGNRETEYIVRQIFENLGYECIGNNSFDREGGDADLIFRDNSLSEFFDCGINAEEVSGDIYVQVKNKTGTDAGDLEGITQLLKRTENVADCTKILISTADTFSDECVRLANRNNILLINGIGFLKLVFKYID